MEWCNSIYHNYVIPTFFYVCFNILSGFYSVLFLLWLTYTIIRNPSKNVLKVKRRQLPPKCINDPAYGNHTYVQLKDVKLHYVEAGNKSKPLIIFLHGFPDFWFSWKNQIKEFSKDFRTVAVDLRGYGDSEKPVGYQYYRAKYILEDIKNLAESFDVKKFILVGHDWGGLITWNFAHKYPEKLEKYVIINAPEPSVFWKYITTTWDQFKKSWYIFFFQVPYLPELSLRMNDLKIFETMSKTLDKEEIEAYKFLFGKPGALTPPLNYYRGIFTKLHSNESQTERSPIEIPGLMIISGNDKALGKNLLETSAKVGGGESMKTKVIAEGGHFVHQEKYEEVNDALSLFLRGN